MGSSGTPSSERSAPPTDDPTTIAGSNRMFVDSGGAFSFFDATFAVAMTLLVTTIAPAVGAWTSWSALWDTTGSQLMAFALSFLLIGIYWWGNRKFLTSLRGITPRIVFLELVMLAFVVLLPVSTNALGEGVQSSDEVATIVYSINIAVISLVTVAQYVMARSEQLLDPTPTSRQARFRIIDGLVTPLVFLLSVAVTIAVSPTAGRFSWMVLIALGPISGRMERRERAATTAVTA